MWLKQFDPLASEQSVRHSLLTPLIEFIIHRWRAIKPPLINLKLALGTEL